MDLFEAFEAFPEVAEPIIIKADVLRLGVRFSLKAKDAIKQRPDIKVKGSHPFSYDHTEPAREIERVADLLYLEDGTREGTLIQVRLGRDTPYEIDFRDSTFELLWNGRRLNSVRFATIPAYWERTLNGVPLSQFCHSSGDHLMPGTLRFCEHFTRSTQCLFCDMGTYLKEKRKEGERWIAVVEPEMAAEAATIAFSEGRFRHIGFGGGTILTKLQGKKEIDWYTDYMDRFLKKLGTRWATTLEISAQDDEGLKKLRDTGISAIANHMEVWDKKLFGILCPGKAEVVGYDEWTKRLIRAVDFFGRGNVITSFVTGIEMAQPFGFKDVDEAVASTLSGHDFLMGNGVLSRMGGIWAVEQTSKLADNVQPPLDFYIKLGKGYWELREKHGFGDQTLAWMCKHCCIHGLEYDLQYWYGTGILSRKAEQRDKDGTGCRRES